MTQWCKPPENYGAIVFHATTNTVRAASFFANQNMLSTTRNVNIFAPAAGFVLGKIQNSLSKYQLFSNKSYYLFRYLIFFDTKSVDKSVEKSVDKKCRYPISKKKVWFVTPESSSV